MPSYKMKVSKTRKNAKRRSKKLKSKNAEYLASRLTKRAKGAVQKGAKTIYANGKPINRKYNRKAKKALTRDDEFVSKYLRGM